MAERPEVLVLSCRGADQGAMSVVRTLGRHGIRVSVLSDSRTCLTQYSRYCAEFTYRPDFTMDKAETLDWLLAFAAQCDTAPVLFPTADPDLALLSQLRPRLEGPFRLFLGPQDLVDRLIDKIRFADLAALHQFPVPRTHAPESESEFLAISESVRYPVVLKPANPAAWAHREIQAAVKHQKALIVDSADQLRAHYADIAHWNHEFLIQEYIVGPDENHYSSHIYVDQNGKVKACFTGRKLRVHPAFAGSGCFVQSVHVPELVKTSMEVLHAIRYTGIAVLNFKQDSRSGDFLLHEINPRISQWNILATRAGVDVPWAAYCEAAGLPVQPMLEQRQGVHYVDLRNDLKSWKQYRSAGQWNVWRYLKSLMQPRMVHQVFMPSDPKPFFECYRRLVNQWLHGVLGRPTQEDDFSFICEIDDTPATTKMEYSKPRPVQRTDAKQPEIPKEIGSRRGV